MASKEEVLFLEQINQNFLFCAICSERYKNAKMLPCLHNFCEPCLVKLASDSCVVCPICRRTQQLSDRGLPGFATNTFLNELVETFEKQDAASPTNCAGCERGTCSAYCVDCGVSLCDICSHAHSRLPTTKSHRVMSLEEYHVAKSDDPASVQRPMFCSQHPNYAVEFYCDVCDTVICLKCIALDHRRHEYRCVKDAAKEYKELLEMMVDKVKAKDTETKASSVAVKEMSGSLDECYKTGDKKMKEHIQRTVLEVTRLITENGNKLLKEFKDEYDARKVSLNAQMKELEIVESDVSTVWEYTENLVKYGNAAQVMSAKKGVSAQMDELLKVETTTEPTENDYMEFQPHDDFCKEKSVGVVLRERTYKLTDIPKFVRVGDDISVAITTETSQRETRGRQKIDVVLKTPDNKVENVEVTEKKDGTLTLKTRTKMEGEHELSVSVNKHSVQKSPLRIKVIPKKGLVSQFGKAGSGVSQLKKPWGLNITRTGRVLVCDGSNHRLQSYSQTGTHHSESMVQFTDVGYEVCPFDVTFSTDGKVFITDQSKKQVFVCDENGKLVKCFGMGRFKWPTGIAVNHINERVYVVDATAHCILIYDKDGNFVKSFGCQGNKDGEFMNAVFLCINDIGNVYVSDKSNNRIQVFDADGHFMYSFGSKGSGDGELNQPRGVCLDKHGFVYVSDSLNNRIMKFESDGKFVCRVDSGGLKEPRGIAVTDDEPFGKVIVSNTGDYGVKVFAQ
ncbi:E3 ubiquitin-protein ligase TRIM71-like [Glandiceps talaboti]